MIRRIGLFTDFRRWDPSAEEATREEFLDGVGLRRRLTPEPPAITQIETAQLENYVKRYVGQAQLFFKALQCISHTWWERLDEWNETSLFLTDTIKLNYFRLTTHDDFKQIYEFFEWLRPSARLSTGTEWKPKTNLNSVTDALALLTLAELNTHAQSARRVPRFYDSTGLFRRVAHQAKIAPRLSAPLPAGGSASTTPTLVGSNYFIYRAALSRRTDQSGESGHTIFLVRKAVEELKEEFTAFSGERKHLSIEELDQLLRVNQSRLGPVMRNLITYAFFEQIWLPGLAGREIRALQDRLALSKRDVASREFSTKYQEIISATQRQLERNTREIRQLRDIWLELSDGIPALQYRLERERRGPGRTFEPVRDLDLVRFDLPRDAQDFVGRFVYALIALGEDYMNITERPEWNELVLRCHEGKREPAKSLRAASVLWAMGALRSIIKYFGWVTDIDAPPTLYAVYATACLHAGLELTSANKAIRRLEAKCQPRTQDPVGTSDELRAQAGFGVELGYLRFHTWLAKGGTAWWRGTRPLRDYPKDDPAIRILEEAIQFVDYAGKCLDALEAGGVAIDDELKLKRVYILYQKLYYRVEQGNPELATEIADARRELKEQEERVTFWDFAYYETLARAYEFESSTSDEQGVQRRLFEIAIDRASAAVMCAPEHPSTPKERLVKNYLDHLLREYRSRFGE